MQKILLLLFLTIIYSCKNKNISPDKPFSPSMLAKQNFQINSAKDTSILTLHSTIINIPAGAFNVTGNITLEIKEAFSPIEILTAGLTTESNRKPLFSAGMIYINASTQNEKVTLIKPIKISMPNEFYDPSMKIFKGVETGNGTINWTAPIQPDSTQQAKTWRDGRLLFSTKCMTCHNIFRQLTGPALANVEERGPWRVRNQLYSFINNPAAYMAHDIYVQNQTKQYNGVVMTGFPALDTAALNAILNYIKNETVRPGAREDEEKLADSLSKQEQQPLPAIDTSINSDMPYAKNKIPCVDDTIYVNTTKPQKPFFENPDTIPTVYNNTSTPVKDNSAESMEGLRKGFIDPNPTSGRYDFEINTIGWYNVDAFVQGYTGTINVKLWGELQSNVKADMHVYLFCPRNKMLSVIYEISDKKFYFDKIDGGIPLFLGDRAILFAFGSDGDKMYYGTTEFWIQPEQTIKIKVNETSDEKIQKALKSGKLDGIDLGIERKEKRILKGNCDNSPLKQ